MTKVGIIKALKEQVGLSTLTQAARLVRANGSGWAAIRGEDLGTAQAFSREAMRTRLPQVWN